MMSSKELAGLLLPDVSEKPEDVIGRYRPRELPETAMVTRFAPSPTGMLHIGGLYAALVSERLAHQSNGVFILRIEDTDKKREVTGSIKDIIESLAYFDIRFDEGADGMDSEAGCYGPYKQSLRMGIYKVFVKKLIERGLAYPCFCSEEELDSIRKGQENSGIRPGYYGKWAVHRYLTADQIKEELEKGKSYVIRLKSPGSEERRLIFRDLIKGDIEMPENDQDIVILKSDGLPTYHFAHAVDDYLMGTTHVIRGDEWLSSVPLHLQLFDILGFKAPYYGHIAPIMKKEGNSKRKFSKRKDLDAAAVFYQEQGYPGQAVTEYFLNLINSNYEEWRERNINEYYTKFPIDTGKMSVSGALFDINKLNDISKNIIATYSAQKVYELTARWAHKYDAELLELMSRHKDYTLKVLNIERASSKPRKDFAKWSDIKQNIGYFYDELFDKADICGSRIIETINKEQIVDIIYAYLDIYNSYDDRTVWFEKLKDMCEQLGYSKDLKSYKKNPAAYKGHVGDVAMVLRVALTNRTNTPDLYEIMQAMGRQRVVDRLKKCLDPVSPIHC